MAICSLQHMQTNKRQEGSHSGRKTKSTFKISEAKASPQPRPLASRPETLPVSSPHQWRCRLLYLSKIDYLLYRLQDQVSMHSESSVVHPSSTQATDNHQEQDPPQTALFFTIAATSSNPHDLHIQRIIPHIFMTMAGSGSLPARDLTDEVKPRSRARVIVACYRLFPAVAQTNDHFDHESMLRMDQIPY
jgi:hypothetical protein